MYWKKSWFFFPSTEAGIFLHCFSCWNFILLSRIFCCCCPDFCWFLPNFCFSFFWNFLLQKILLLAASLFVLLRSLFSCPLRLVFCCNLSARST
ncbi:hypothetical protein M9H77_34405 [Catharanthus roseus]|uniref:Uncharacterized protein n=1 Tax=Catharanthus roseus TaxID=4058 RepID=A0ACB9ZPP7_CATRO|nr:hypothetical protein M9H77_34405 [Catharanthus roseus]